MEKATAHSQCLFELFINHFMGMWIVFYLSEIDNLSNYTSHILKHTKDIIFLHHCVLLLTKKPGLSESSRDVLSLLCRKVSVFARAWQTERGGQKPEIC